MDEYLKLKNWLDNNLNIKIKIPKTEIAKIKFCIIMFRFLSKFNLMNLFSKIYCKEK